MGSTIVRVIRAHTNETVEIQWRNDAGEKVVERHTPPPPDVWKVRRQPAEKRED